MDKVKKILAIAKKQHFWILTAIVMLTALWGWWSASATLLREFNDHKSQIGQKQSSLQSIQSGAHPNETVIEGYIEDTKRLRENVATVWHKLYHRQRTEVLKWPPELGVDFIEHVDNKSFGDEIRVDFRERYQNYVKERFLELPEIVEALVEKETESRNAFLRTPDNNENENENAAPPAKDDYVVIWDNLESIQRRLEWEQTPSSKMLWVTQEDLWVYETLLRVIANTNEGKRHYNAAVTQIHELLIGNEAASRNSTRGRVQGASQAGDSGEGGVAAAGESGGGEDSMLTGRYLDESGSPLRPGESNAIQEYKRMPVYMQLTMEQQMVPKLLTECANAALPVEVNQVRINAEKSEGPRTTRERMRAEQLAARKDKEIQRASLVPVTIQGIIYIFNPPDYEKLKVTPPAEENPQANERGSSGTEKPEASEDLPTADPVQVDRAAVQDVTEENADSPLPSAPTEIPAESN